MTFVHSEYLYFLLLLVPVVYWHFMKKQRGEAALRLPTMEPFRRHRRTLRLSLIHLPFFLRILTLAALLVVMARPQTHFSLTEKETEGIDIIMAMDISTSMYAEDFNPNRLEVAKKVAYEFISNRPYDNIGLTLFSGEAFMQCPLTLDHKALLSMWPNITCSLAANGTIASGTAIGMGLANAVSHLEKSKTKSKVVILLTDGENNTGEISPMTAAELAKESGIRVYTIAVGKPGEKSSQIVGQLPNGEYYKADVENAGDPETLKMIAHTTGGVFYQADNPQKLKEIYNDIDRLEKTKLKVLNHNKRYEAYGFFGWMALGFLLLEVLLRLTLLRRIP